MDRLTAYIDAGNQNRHIAKKTCLGLNYKKTLDFVLSFHRDKFDVDRLDSILLGIIKSSLSSGILPDIKLAMKLYGEMT